MRKLTVGVICGAALVLAAPGYADQLTVSATGVGEEGSVLGAEAIFCIDGGQLTIQLTNTSADFVRIPSDLLSGVFWNMDSSATLTPVSVVLADGSSVLFPETTFTGTGVDANGEIGGEYGFADDISSGFGGAEFGVEANGLGPFGEDSLFPGDNLHGPVAPDGLNYGLVSAGGIDPDVDSGPLSGDNPFVMNSVVFTFDIDGELSASDISVTGFQYGTSEEQPFIPPPPPVPEPATMVLFGTGLAALAGTRMRKRA